MTYTLWFRTIRYQASSKRKAISTARRILGVSRVFKGAEYVTDEAAGNDNRVEVNALDMWANRENARRQMERLQTV